MALRIRTKGKAPFIPVPLGGAAFFRLRAATTSEVETAQAAIGFKVAAILCGGDEAAQIAKLLPGFDFGDLPMLAGKPRAEVAELMAQLGIKTRLDRLTETLLLIELCTLCGDGWNGIIDEDGAELSCDPGGIAALLEDPTIALKCRTRVFSSVHEEISEKN